MLGLQVPDEKMCGKGHQYSRKKVDRTSLIACASINTVRHVEKTKQAIKIYAYVDLVFTAFLLGAFQHECGNTPIS